MKNINVEENNSELIEYQSTCYEVFTKKNIKQVTRKESVKSFLRII